MSKLASATTPPIMSRHTNCDNTALANANIGIAAQISRDPERDTVAVHVHPYKIGNGPIGNGSYEQLARAVDKEAALLSAGINGKRPDHVTASYAILTIHGTPPKP